MPHPPQAVRRHAAAGPAAAPPPRAGAPLTHPRATAGGYLPRCATRGGSGRARATAEQCEAVIGGARSNAQTGAVGTSPAPDHRRGAGGRNARSPLWGTPGSRPTSRGVAVSPDRRPATGGVRSAV